VAGDFNNVISNAYGYTTLQNGGTLSVKGTFTTGYYQGFDLNGPGNTATLGSLQNGGGLLVDTGSMVNVGTWLDLDSSGNLRQSTACCLNLDGGRLNYTFDASGVTASD